MAARSGSGKHCRGTIRGDRADNVGAGDGGDDHFGHGCGGEDSDHNHRETSRWLREAVTRGTARERFAEAADNAGATTIPATGMVALQLVGFLRVVVLPLNLLFFSPLSHF
ncbi:putative zinc transporter ZIP10-like isoform X2 [Sesbania bispinosa]|nr:putative zinc transporter ZIP10-like isoform X2 [Sesbania bispinosa]